ncbi:MAG: type II secretion system GspH family protein [Prosthecobacter sp.]|jgi:type II secretory pathway pseudopilin PulG|nr:type II secretion system GspH family protein [Prosthecobacter sp.]
MTQFHSGTNFTNARPNHGPGKAACGFTLIEVCIAMGLCMMILGIGALSITGMQDQARLKKAAAEIERTARQTLQESISTRQLITLALDGTLGQEAGRVQIKRVGDKDFRNARRGEVWEFSPTGICEPIEVRITSPAGVIELAFDPLTACAVRKNVSVKS